MQDHHCSSAKEILSWNPACFALYKYYVLSFYRWPWASPATQTRRTSALGIRNAQFLSHMQWTATTNEKKKRDWSGCDDMQPR